MRVLILFFAYLLHAANTAPQFLTFKDGKIGVNFGGYHASAGLGGLLTGDAAHGGLSASAGTPWGQNAAAGLGGSLDGRTSGFGYAGAQASPSVGASAALGGNAGQNGFIGSEAHADGKMHSKTISSAAAAAEAHDPVTSAPAPSLESRSDFIQKIKPPKKYSLIKSEETPSQSQSQSQSKSQSQSIPNAPPIVENADHNLITIASNVRDHVGAPSNSNSNSNSNPETVIYIHRQRMRERRRLQQHQQETQNDLQQKRTNEHRIRTRQRLHQRQRDHATVLRNKDIDMDSTSSTNITAQHLLNTDVNVAHSKQLVKNFQKFADAPPPPPPPALPQLPSLLPYAPPNNQIQVHYNANPGALGNIFNIPIGILRTIQESLTGVQVEKNLSISG